MLDQQNKIIGELQGLNSSADTEVLNNVLARARQFDKGGDRRFQENQAQIKNEIERLNNIVKTKSEMNSVMNYKEPPSKSPRVGNINPMEEVDSTPKVPAVAAASPTRVQGVVQSTGLGIIRQPSHSKKNQPTQRQVKVLFDNDVERIDGGNAVGYGTSDIDAYGLDTDAEGQSIITRNAHVGYGVDDGGKAIRIRNFGSHHQEKPTVMKTPAEPPKINVALRPSTKESRASKMTQMTQQTTITKQGVNATPFIAKKKIIKHAPSMANTDMRSKYDDGMSTKTRRVQSNPRGMHTIDMASVPKAKGNINYQAPEMGHLGSRRASQRHGPQQTDRSGISSRTQMRGGIRADSRDKLPDINNKNITPIRMRPFEFNQQPSEATYDLYNNNQPRIVGQSRGSIQTETPGFFGHAKVGNYKFQHTTLQKKILRANRGHNYPTYIQSEHNYPGAKANQSPGVSGLKMDDSVEFNNMATKVATPPKPERLPEVKKDTTPKRKEEKKSEHNITDHVQLDSKITGEFAGKIDKSLKLTEEKTEKATPSAPKRTDSVNTGYNANKQDIFLAELSDGAKKNVLGPTKTELEKKRLLADQKDIQRKQLELQRQQIILQQQKLQLQLDRLEENQQKQKALEGKQHDVAVGTSVIEKSVANTEQALKVSDTKISVAEATPATEKQISVAEVTPPQKSELKRDPEASQLVSQVEDPNLSEGVQKEQVDDEEIESKSNAATVDLSFRKQANDSRFNNTNRTKFGFLNTTSEKDSEHQSSQITMIQANTLNKQQPTALRQSQMGLMGSFAGVTNMTTNVLCVQANIAGQLAKGGSPSKMMPYMAKGIRTGPEIFEQDAHYQPPLQPPVYGTGKGGYYYGKPPYGGYLPPGYPPHYHGGKNESSDTDADYYDFNDHQQNSWKYAKQIPMPYDAAKGQYYEHFPSPHEGNMHYSGKHQAYQDISMHDQNFEGQGPNYNPRNAESPSRNIMKEREEQSREFFEGHLPNNTFQKLFKQPLMRKPSNFTHDQNSIQQQTDMDGDMYYTDPPGKELINSPSKSKQSKKAGLASQGLMSESHHARSGVQIFETGKGGHQMNTTGFHHRNDKSKQQSKDRIQEEELQENSSVERENIRKQYKDSSAQSPTNGSKSKQPSQKLSNQQSKSTKRGALAEQDSPLVVDGHITDDGRTDGRTDARTERSGLPAISAMSKHYQSPIKIIRQHPHHRIMKSEIKGHGGKKEKLQQATFDLGNLNTNQAPEPEKEEALPTLAQSNRKIPHLKYAKGQEKNTFFQNPHLSPVTFVSKDQAMKADYHIDSEFEEIGPSAGGYNNPAIQQRLAGSELQMNPALSPMSPAYPGSIPFAGGYPPHMLGQMPPMGMQSYPYPPVHPGYAIGPDGQLQVATPAQIAQFYQNMQYQQYGQRSPGGHAQSQGLIHHGQLSGLDGRLDTNISQDSKTKMFMYRKSQESAINPVIHEQSDEVSRKSSQLNNQEVKSVSIKQETYSPQLKENSSHQSKLPSNMQSNKNINQSQNSPSHQDNMNQEEGTPNPDEAADQMTAQESEYSQISRTLDQEMRQFIHEFEKMVSTNDRRSELMMRRIRIKHPIFHLLTINAFKYLFENAVLFKLKPGQNVYKEYQPAKAHFYFVLYGQLQFKNTKCGQFGEQIGLGWTIGEEILYGEDDQKEILRLENCTSMNSSCLLQCSVDDLVCMSTQKHVTAGGGNLEQDYKILLSFLEKNFEVKSKWREEKGLLVTVKEVKQEEEDDQSR